MRSDLALFDVDTRQPAEAADGLVFRPRVAAIAERLSAVLAWADRAAVRTVCTACVNAGPIRPVLPEGALFVPADADDLAWRRGLGDCRSVWLEKRSCGSPRANVERRAFDVFAANPHAADVLARLGVPYYVVVGDSACYCTASTAEGLIRLGYRVTLLADAIGVGIDDEPAKAGMLAELSRRGAAVRTVGDFLAEAR